MAERTFHIEPTEKGVNLTSKSGWDFYVEPRNGQDQVPAEIKSLTAFNSKLGGLIEFERGEWAISEGIGKGNGDSENGSILGVSVHGKSKLGWSYVATSNPSVNGGLCRLLNNKEQPSEIHLRRMWFGDFRILV
jgi:hypothetical protein